MTRFTLKTAVVLTAVLLCGALHAAEPMVRPNIVYVLCDDLGYGDLRCYNEQGKISTPHFDALARAGMKFTDAHSGSSVCTPTRYGILTGRYAWRSKLQTHVLGGLSPRLIEPNRLTVAALLKEQGYHTACIGKWHLGLDWVKHPGKEVTELGIEPLAQNWNVDYSQPFANGPLSLGFDEYFGIAGSLDMVPYTFLKQDRVTIVPTVEKAFPMMLGRGMATTRKGPAAESFEASEVLPTFTAKAIEYIASRAAAAKRGEPFFLYVPYASPHTPIVPTEAWQAKSGLNPYADFVMQQDDSLGQILKALDEHGLAENTLVIATSDNGCSPQADFADLAKAGHHPSGPLRGAKADIYEGGHRVPLLVRWPSKVKPGSTSEQTVCLTDLLATCSELLEKELPDDAGEDSMSMLPALLSRDDKPLREATVHHSINGSFAIRQGKWKLIACSDSGGWSAPRPGQKPEKPLPAVQLYDLEADLAERANLAEKRPEIVEQLARLLERYVAEGRSTAGEPQQNAVDVNLWKFGGRPAAAQP
jgi:arylsulfatase A